MADNNNTIIGESITISGNLQGDEDLTVFGRIEGTIQLTSTITIANGGIVKADVTVRNAIISGIVVGNISASDSVEISADGRMVGDIKAPRIIIIEGARFRGNIDMGDLEAPRASGPAVPRPASVRPPLRTPTAPVKAPPRLAPAATRVTPAAAPTRPVVKAPDKTVVEPAASAAPKAKPTAAGTPVGTKIKKKVVVRKR